MYMFVSLPRRRLHLSKLDSCRSGCAYCRVSDRRRTVVVQMEDMIMEAAGSPLMLRKLQNLQSQPYQAHQQDDYINSMGPGPSQLTDLHAHHDLLHHDIAMSRSMLLPFSSLMQPQDAIVNLLLASSSSFPYNILRKREEEKDEEEGLGLVSSLPFSDAQLLSSTASCFLGGADGRDLDSSYSTQVLQYGSGGGSGRNSSDGLSSPYNSTPISECAQCSAIDHPSSSSGQYLSQGGGSAVAAHTSLNTEDLSGLLRQSIKDEPHSCLGNEVREVVHKDGGPMSYITKAPRSHLQGALSGTSSCSTPTSMTSALTSCHHVEVQANLVVMALDESLYNPASKHHRGGDHKALSEMANTVVVKQEDAHQTATGSQLHEKKKKRKRKRTSHKNVQEMESQRMTHIAVERNRRKQMNEHLHALRMLMPHSYIQRGDQASIVGGTIRFIEELEQVLQALQFQKKIQSHQDIETFSANFDDRDFHGACKRPHKQENSHVEEVYASIRSSMADVEVTMATSSIIIAKVLTQKRPHQLLHTLLALSGLSLKVMHINITATELIILYCFNLEMEDDCQLHTCNDIAESFQHIFSV